MCVRIGPSHRQTGQHAPVVRRLELVRARSQLVHRLAVDISCRLRDRLGSQKTGMSFTPNNAFEEKFRQFLAEPGTQDAIRSDQEKEIGIMKKIDEFQSLEELQGQREQLAVALQVHARSKSPLSLQVI